MSQPELNTKRTPTKEQQAVIGTLKSGVPLIEVGSFAGTGKTSLLEMCVEAMPASNKFLYIVFSKSGEIEAKKRFARFENVTCKTIDALALANFPREGNERVTIGFYKRQDLERLLNLNRKTAKKTLDLFEAFCNGSELCIDNPNVQAFWDMMEIGKINPSFSFIKKSFHLNLALNPRDLPINKYGNYSVIMIDEFQDTNPVTLEIAKHISSKSYVRVGDAHQSIYGFRGASNVMGSDKDAMQLHLTQSFRFNQTIADKANKILGYYKKEEKKIVGLSNRTKMTSACMLSRTNATLIGVIKKLYEAKTPYKTIRDASLLFDLPVSIHNLEIGKKQRQSCFYLEWEYKKFKQGGRYGSFIEYLSDTAKQNNDKELATAAKIAKDIPLDLMLKMEAQTNTYNKQQDLQVSYFLSTIHTAKGLEWDYVKIADDTYDYPKMIAQHIYEQYGEVSNPKKYDFVESFAEDVKGGFVKEEIIEEFNLLYVALTRAKVKVDYSEAISNLFDKSKTNLAVYDAYRDILEKEERQELKEGKEQNNSYLSGINLAM